MISALSTLGEPNPEVVNDILNNKEYQDYLINNIIRIMQNVGYQGLNMVLSRITESNQIQYIDLITNVSNRLGNEGFLLFITLNPNIQFENNVITFEKLDYGTISKLCYRLIFLQYYWGVNTGPPSPVSSITLLRSFMDYVVSTFSPTNISIGKPLIAYDWTLPYIPNKSFAYSMTLNSAITLASDTGTVILFDEFSQTPYFYYYQSYVGENVEHIVWSIDARSITAIDDLIIDYNLDGSGIWNIMVYYQQMWTLINSRFEIIKFIPDQLS
jgi:spore germination protein